MIGISGTMTAILTCSSSEGKARAVYTCRSGVQGCPQCLRLLSHLRSLHMSIDAARSKTAANFLSDSCLVAGLHLVSVNVFWIERTHVNCTVWISALALSNWSQLAVIVQAYFRLCGSYCSQQLEPRMSFFLYIQDLMSQLVYTILMISLKLFVSK